MSGYCLTTAASSHVSYQLNFLLGWISYSRTLLDVITPIIVMSLSVALQLLKYLGHLTYQSFFFM